MDKAKKKPKANDLDKFLGKKLKYLRLQRGFSQEELSSLVGVTFQQLQKYEAGTNRMAASRLYEISKALKVNLLEFFVGYEDITPETKPLYQYTEDRYFMKIVRVWPDIDNTDLKRTLTNLLDQSKSA